ncbi:hypothetical protein BV22DRAFT_1055199 [Leucogyrophana mollusca]|uniref:Uncharacterized protein n=1 Tax=Leucogyrophana mollusca TaxID=85980 RepID=A0ACB8BXR4_9AGAM|nr:hypothetical protein BV22DRAFT_1055199 [Leucogyrophana mollusca]
MFSSIAGPSKYASKNFTSRRCISSKARAQHDAKMRALVSLYHQSDAFITPENLSDAIDETFTGELLASGSETQSVWNNSQAELYTAAMHRRRMPKFFLGRDEGSANKMPGGMGYTDNKDGRTERMHEALMGADMKGRPSWAVLKENAERVTMQLKVDRRQGV